MFLHTTVESDVGRGGDGKIRAMINSTRMALLMKLRKRRIITTRLISVLAFFFLSTLMSENKTWNATFGEVNQAARRATALSFYVSILLYISPISIAFICLISSFFNHSISLWLMHPRDLFACCSLCQKVLFEFHEFALASERSDFQTSHSEPAAHMNTKQSQQAAISSQMFYNVCTCVSKCCA